MVSLKLYRTEVHVHTVLSPCAGVEMIPPLIVEEARKNGIQLLAITDHNASANVGAVKKAAIGSEITVLAGMEVQTKEEVHMLCLFDTLEQLEAWQVIVDRHLPLLENNPDFFGEQYVVDETGDLVRRETRLLLTSTDLTLDEAFRAVEDLGGLAIPAHVDRQAYGLFASLGFIPPEIPFQALEVSGRRSLAAAMQKFPPIQQYPLIQSGDVHYIADFLGANHFLLAKPTIEEIKLAFHQEEGRSHQVINPHYKT